MFDQLSKGRAPLIAKYEMNKVLSERGSLIIYLDKVRYQPPFSSSLFLLISFCLCIFISFSFVILPQVSHTRPEIISFKLHQTLKVGVLQPAAVSVYEYYDRTSLNRIPPSLLKVFSVDGRLYRTASNVSACAFQFPFFSVSETPCVKFYHPERRAGQLLQLCRDDECTCAEGRQHTSILKHQLNSGSLKMFLSLLFTVLTSSQSQHKRKTKILHRKREKVDFNLKGFIWLSCKLIFHFGEILAAELLITQDQHIFTVKPETINH